MLALSASQALDAMVASEHAEAGWVWGLAPAAARGPALRGAALAILGALVLPVLVLVGVVASFAWGPLQAAGFVVFSGALAAATLRWMHGIVEHFPCTMTLENARRQTTGLRALGLFVVTSVVAGIDAALAHRFGPWVPFVLAAPLLAWGWRGLAAAATIGSGVRP
jgi:hypothetical protein